MVFSLNEREQLFMLTTLKIIIIDT